MTMAKHLSDQGMILVAIHETGKSGKKLHLVDWPLLPTAKLSVEEHIILNYLASAHIIIHLLTWVGT